jgi:signal peptidase II
MTDRKSSATPPHDKAALGLAAALIMVCLDQAVKYLVALLLPYGTEVRVLPFLSFLYVRNTGAAFSMLSNRHPAMLLLLTTALTLPIVWLFLKNRERTLLSIGYGMILGGAVGNIIDRLVRGQVVDFVFLHWRTWTFAIFNVADSAITLGVALILVHIVFAHRGRSAPPHGGVPSRLS